MPCFFVTFNFIISHIFWESFIEIPHVIQKMWRSFSPILTIFINISDFLTFHFYKETNDVSTYLHPALNRLLRWGGRVVKFTPYEKLLSKSPAFLGLKYNHGENLWKFHLLFMLMQSLYLPNKMHAIKSRNFNSKSKHPAFSYLFIIFALLIY